MWDYRANGVAEWHTRTKMDGKYRQAPVLVDRLQAVGNWNVSAARGTLRWTTTDAGKTIPTGVHRSNGGVPEGGNFLFEDGHVEWRTFKPESAKTMIDVGSRGGEWVCFYKIPISE